MQAPGTDRACKVGPVLNVNLLFTCRESGSSGQLSRRKIAKIVACHTTTHSLQTISITHISLHPKTHLALKCRFSPSIFDKIAAKLYKSQFWDIVNKTALIAGTEHYQCSCKVVPYGIGIAIPDSFYLLISNVYYNINILKIGNLKHYLLHDRK